MEMLRKKVLTFGKTQIYLVILSLNRTLATPNLGCISTIKMKKIVFSFCIVFDLHYLCTKFNLSTF